MWVFFLYLDFSEQQWLPLKAGSFWLGISLCLHLKVFLSDGWISQKSCLDLLTEGIIVVANFLGWGEKRMLRSSIFRTLTFIYSSCFHYENPS